MKRRVALTLLAAACEAEPDLTADAALPPAAHENVLLIIADDVGVDQVPSYGIGTHTKAAMPNVDNLAAQGTRLTQAWANPVCSPTRASILTGTMPYQHGIGRPVPDGAAGLDGGTTTLAEVLTDRDSAVLGKWHLGVVDDLGATFDATDHGFVEHKGTAGGEPSTSYYNWQRYVASTNTSAVSTTYATTKTETDALAWITSQAGTPWFAVAAFNAGHWALDGSGNHIYENPTPGCGSPMSGATDAAKYRLMLECMDDRIGDLLDGIDAIGELENTTVIFVGDNGTEAPLDGYYTNAHAKDSPYQGGIHVPLIFADGYRLVHGADDPDTSHYKVKAGATATYGMHVVDLYPTIAEIAGFTTSPSAWATSLKSRLSSGLSLITPHTLVYAESFTLSVGGTMAHCEQALREARTTPEMTLSGRGMMKLVRETGTADRLYAVSDEAEATDLAATWPAVVTSLAAQLPHTCNLSY